MIVRLKLYHLKAVFIGLGLVIGLSVNAYSMIIANWGSPVFVSPNKISSPSIISCSLLMANWGDPIFMPPNGKSTSSIEMYITDGAGYFLKAYSDTLAVLQKVEVSTSSRLDYDELRVLLRSAGGNMESAVCAYRNLKALAESTPYNPVMIERLKTIDYKTFRAARTLNASTFDDVEKYLVNGDVRGVFSRLLTNSEEILKLLQTVYNTVEADSFPEIATLWRVNRLFSETLIFGQISAEVFFEISK